jgi:aryl-alcohol dehydrogenase-like predicted oxidoreductase
MGLTDTDGQTVDREETLAFVRSAVERGIMLFDTAEAYGPYGPPLGAAIEGRSSVI